MNVRRFPKCFSSVISPLLMSSGFLISIVLSWEKSATKKRRTRRTTRKSLRVLRFFVVDFHSLQGPINEQLSYNCREGENAFRLTKQISIRQLMEEWIRQPVSRLKARFLDGREPAPRGLLEALAADSRRGARELAASLRARARAN